MTSQKTRYLWRMRAGALSQLNDPTTNDAKRAGLRRRLNRACILLKKQSQRWHFMPATRTRRRRAA